MHWINVKDSLPGLKKRVFCYEDDTYIYLAHLELKEVDIQVKRKILKEQRLVWVYQEIYGGNIIDISMSMVKYWAPLPKVPSDNKGK